MISASAFRPTSGAIDWMPARAQRATASLASVRAAIPTSLFRGGQTMASLIANGFLEASPGTLEISAYIAVGFLLMILALIVNILAQVLVARVLKVKGGAVE